MPIGIDDLEGEALDWAVQQALAKRFKDMFGQDPPVVRARYSSDLALIAGVISSFGVSLRCCDTATGRMWLASCVVQDTELQASFSVRSRSKCMGQAVCRAAVRQYLALETETLDVPADILARTE